MGRERNLVFDDRLKDFTPVTHIKGEVNRQGIRKMTPREWARLQDFPDNYIIPVADASAYKQFGNSVAVPVIVSKTYLGVSLSGRAFGFNLFVRLSQKGFPLQSLTQNAT